MADRLLHRLYGATPEQPSVWLRLLTTRRASALLGHLNYDRPIARERLGALARSLGIDLADCLDPLDSFATRRQLFERRIRYWQTRPMTPDPHEVVSPADARVLLGSLAAGSRVFVKDKFFDLAELLGPEKAAWLGPFRDADLAIFRLTPDKYHYNHTPVAGTVLDLYEVAGAYHSCNPGPIVAMGAPFSKNRRVVTILDTDVPGGTGVGRVAMIEVVALMVGQIVQCYSTWRYDRPTSIGAGMFLEKGQPKSLYRPGSSTDVLLFERGRVAFCEDLVHNTRRVDVRSRYSLGFGRAVVETDVQVRSTIGAAVRGNAC